MNHHPNYWPGTREEQGSRTDAAERQDEELWERLMRYLHTRTLLLGCNQLDGSCDPTAVCNALLTFAKLGVTRVALVAEADNERHYTANTDSDLRELADYVAERAWEGDTYESISNEVDERIMDIVDRESEPEIMRDYE